MSGATIFVDLEAIHPVVDGVWHRGRFTHVPRPGEEIELLCGMTSEAGFKSLATRGVVQTCWSCDLVYRRDKRIPVTSDHPALTQQRRPAPHPRSA